MKLAVFYPQNLTCAWSLQDGLCDTLERMSHEVTRCGITDKLRRPRDLNAYDALIVSGPEHIGSKLRAQKDWESAKVPKVGWLHESVRREDYGTLDVEAIKRTCDQVFCPALEDEEFGFTHLPFGVDTAMFREDPDYGDTGSYGPARDIDLAFIGMMYPKRQAYLNTLPAEFRAKLTIGNCLVQDIHGANIRKSMELYADTLRRIKVFYMLPALSRLTVTKIYEAKACGAVIATSPEQAEVLLANDAQRELASRTNSEKTIKEDLLEKRCEVLLSHVRAGVAA